MRSVVRLLILAVVALSACDDARVFEKNVDFEHKAWMINDKPEFEFAIDDTSHAYNIYCNVRNSVSYPYSRLFFTYYVEDSLGLVVKKDLIQHTMFDKNTGEPSGSSGLGDIFDHRVPLLTGHQFPYKGVHKIKLEQFMRKDTLDGIFAVGVRVEKASNEK